MRLIAPDGTISTVAGTGAAGYNGDGIAATSAQLNFPSGVAVLADGSFLIADNDNHRIRRVAGGTISTVAGTGIPGYNGDAVAATSAQINDPAAVEALPGGGFVFTEVQGHRLRRVLPDGTIATVAGTGVAGGAGDGGPAAAAQLNGPIGVAVAADGGILIADRLNHRVRRVAPDGTISTVAGTGAAGFAGDGGVATAAQLSTPIGVAVTADGDYLVADTANQRVRRVDADAVPSPPPPPPILLSASAKLAKSATVPGATWVGVIAEPPPGADIVRIEYDTGFDGIFEPDFACGTGLAATSLIYTTAGTKTVAIRVTDSRGDTALVTDQVVVQPKDVSKLRNALATHTCEDPGADFQPDSSDCVKTFGLGFLEVNSRGRPTDCFDVRQDILSLKKTKERDFVPGLWTVGAYCYRGTIRGPIAVNGLLLDLPADRVTTIDCAPWLAKPKTIPTADVSFGPFRLRGVAFPDDWRGNGALLGEFATAGAVPAIGGLGLSGRVTVALRKHASVATLTIALPSVFTVQGGKPATGRVSVENTNRDGYKLDSAAIEVGALFLGPLQVERFSLAYTAAGNRWDGGADLVLPGGFELSARAVDRFPDNGFHLVNGRLERAGATLEFPQAARPHLFTGVFLKHIGYSFGFGPTRFLGFVGLDVSRFADVDGTLLAVFATPEQPYTIPGGVDGLGLIAGRTVRTTTFAAGGDVSLAVPVLGKIALGSGYLFYAFPDFVEVQGRYGLDTFAPTVTIGGDVGGWVQFGTGRFNVEGGAEVCLNVETDIPFVPDIHACRGTQAVVSSRGVGVCVSILVTIGVGYRWGDTFPDIQFFECDRSAWREINPFAGRRLAGTTEGGTFTVPAGAPSVSVRVIGTAGAPLVSVSGPDGPIPFPTDAIGDGKVARLVAPALNLTTIGLDAPKPGTYTITPEPGSPPISRIESAVGVELPTIEAALSDAAPARAPAAAGRRELSYSVSELAGRTITFYEQGTRTYRELGRATAAKGTLRFTPADGDAGPRRILAVIERDGIPLDTVVVARYTAAAPARPAVPARVRVTRTAPTTLRVGFRGVAGASRYAVTLTTRSGQRVMRLVRRPTATFRDSSIGAGTVTVVALAKDGRASQPARATVRAAARP